MFSVDNLNQINFDRLVLAFKCYVEKFEKNLPEGYEIVVEISGKSFVLKEIATFNNNALILRGISTEFSPAVPIEVFYLPFQSPLVLTAQPKQLR